MTTVAAPAAAPSEASIRRVFSLVALAVVLSTLDLFIVNIAFPSIQASFHGSTITGVSWVLNAYAIVFAALLVPMGKLGDVVGRRAVFAAGLALFGIGSGLCAVSGTLEMLVVARVLQAVGAAAVTPTSLGLLLPSVPPERRPMMIGAWASLGAIGAAAGPVLGGLLTQISWHWIFIVNVPFALIGAGLSLRDLPEIRDESNPPLPDWLGTVILVLAVALATLALVEGSAWNWDGRFIGTLAGSGLICALFVWRSSHHRAPVFELSILRARPFAISCAAGALFYAAFGAMLLSSVEFLTNVWHFSPITAGLAMTPGPIVAGILTQVSAKLSIRFGPGRVGGIGALLYAASCGGWILLMTTSPNYWGAFLPPTIIGGVGIGLVLPSFTIAGMPSLPPALFSTGIGAMTMFRQIGAALGVAAMIAILGSPGPATVIHAYADTRYFMIGVVVLAGAALLTVKWPPKPPVGTGQ